MAAADTKEIAQCLAFAYFAEFPNYEKNLKELQDPHALEFYKFFIPAIQGNQPKEPKIVKKYMGDAANFEVTRIKYLSTITPKSKSVKHNDTVRTVYKVARFCIENKLFKFPLKDYLFLGQKDPFTLLIKNQTLDMIRKTFNLSFKIDALSPIDIFIIKKTAKTAITNEFKKKFDSPEKILKNSLWGNSGVDDYAGVMAKHMNSGELIPVSLKLPTALSASMHIKRVQFGGTDIATEVDPYIKFLSVILENPTDTKNIIEKVIQIDTRNFSMGANLNWVFPVNFNFSNLKYNGIPLAKYNLRFNLFAQGHGAGWNGQFDSSTKLHQATQWVGGIGAATFEYFANSYPEYKMIIKKVSDIRLSVLKDIGHNLQKKDAENFKKYILNYNAAIHEASQQRILSIAESYKTILFFNKIGKESSKISPLFTQYMELVMKNIRGFSMKYSDAYDSKGALALTAYDKTEAHYVHAQISYFLLNAGRNGNMYFKQKMFLTIFGLITKKSHMKIDDYGKMKLLIQQEFLNKKQMVIAEFASPPHYIVS